MAHITDKEITEIEAKAEKIREIIIEMLVEAQSGHTAGPLGMADIFAALYFRILNHDPQNPEMEDRDRLILSNGHIVPVRYAAMALAGFFKVEETKTLRKLGSRLQGHPELVKLPGLESTSGPLGCGLSQAAGIAYGARMDGKKFSIYCCTGDGELDAGNIWEAAMFVGSNKLSSITVIVDRNNIQINGMTEEVMPLEDLKGKFESFNFHVLEIDGHNIEAIVNATEEAKAIYEKPVAIIAHTIPGKGIPEIEGKYEWHGKPPSKEQEREFLHALRTCGGKVTGEYA